MYLANPQNCLTQRMNPDMNSGFYLMIIYQYHCIHWNKYSTPMQNFK